MIANGWSERKKCFKRAYQDDAYDASVLAIPLMNMLPVDDPKVKLTVKNITDHLGTGGLLKRFEEEPHAFMLSSLWLAQVMMKKGKVVSALDIINRAAATLRVIWGCSRRSTICTTSGWSGTSRSLSRTRNL